MVSRFKVGIMRVFRIKACSPKGKYALTAASEKIGYCAERKLGNILLKILYMVHCF